MSEPSYPYLSNTNADMRLIGFPNILSPFTANNSAPRISMLNHHLPQTMIIAKPEFNKIYTGIEHKFIDYTFNSSKREHDCEILAVIPKYRDPVVSKKLCPQFYVIVLTHEPNNVRRLDYFEINRYFMGTNNFGWIPQEDLQHIVKGEFLLKDTPISHSPAVQGNEYRLGANLNVAYGSFPETIEDAFIISESAAAKLQTQQISQKTITCRMDRRPLNLNGNEYDDKFLPDIGSLVRDDGALCASRPIHWTTVLADTDPEALREPLPLQDDIIYVEAGSKILDITYMINHKKMNNCYDQAIKYDRNNLKCWEDIFTVYTQHKNSCSGLTSKMSTLVRTSIYRMIAQGTHIELIGQQFRKAMRSFEIEGSSGQPIEFMQAVVTYTVPRPVSKGSKLTDSSGAKGVVGVVHPDEWMPVDEYGIRADIMIDMNSPVGRNNPGQLYETGINRIGEFVRREVERVYTVQGADAAFAKVNDYYNDVNPKYAELVEKGAQTTARKKQFVKEVIENGPRVWIPPFLDKFTPSDQDFWNALTGIKALAEKWGVKPSRITYRTLQPDGTGKQFTSEVPFSIGSKYIYHLHKIPEIFAPGPASVNHIGIPTKPPYETKNFPVSSNPYRYGEDELRIVSMDTAIREVVRLKSLASNSPLGVQMTIRTLLTSADPTRIKRMPISNGKLMETDAILSLFHNTASVLGVESRSTRNDELTQHLFNILDTSNELSDSIWKTNIVNSKEGQSVTERDRNVSKRSTQKRERLQKMIDVMGTEDVLDPGEEFEDEDDAESVLEE